MPAFGERLKELRERAALTQETVAARMKLKRPTPISLWEGPRQHAIPKPATIKRLATALGCQPWELLDGVETEYDRLRRGASSDGSVATESSAYTGAGEARELLRRYEREQADVAATRQALGQQLGEILAQINRAFGGLAATISRLPRGQVAVARRRGPGSAAHRGRRRGRPDQRRAPKTPPE